jgi:hypothetical protein
MNSFVKSLLNVLCRGVTAVKDKIYIGGEDKVIILNIDGSLVRKITTDRVNYNLLYNERNDQLLLRQDDRLCCINLDGHVIYRYDIEGSCLFNTISRNVPSGDNLCMSFELRPLMYT